MEKVIEKCPHCDRPHITGDAYVGLGFAYGERIETKLPTDVCLRLAPQAYPYHPSERVLLFHLACAQQCESARVDWRARALAVEAVLSKTHKGVKPTLQQKAMAVDAAASMAACLRSSGVPHLKVAALEKRVTAVLLASKLEKA